MLSAAASECLESKCHYYYHLLITDELTCTTIVLNEEARLLLPPLPAGRGVGLSAPGSFARSPIHYSYFNYHYTNAILCLSMSITVYMNN